MGNIISIAADPSETEPRGEAENSRIYHKPAKMPITSAETSADSYGLLGTPQERLGILRTEIRNAIDAKMPLRFDFVSLPAGGNALVIVIPGANLCAACGWWNLEPSCANEECERHQNPA